LTTERYIQHIPQFRVYNREQELARREREEKESAWEQELLQAMMASDPTGFQHPVREDHSVLTYVTGSDTTVDVPREGSLDTSEKRHQEEYKNRVCAGTVAPNVRAGVIGNFKKRDDIGRRHSDQSNKGKSTKILPLVRNKTVAATCEDHLPQDNIDQCKYDVFDKKNYTRLVNLVQEAQEENLDTLGHVQSYSILNRPFIVHPHPHSHYLTRMFKKKMLHVEINRKTVVCLQVE